MDEEPDGHTVFKTMTAQCLCDWRTLSLSPSYYREKAPQQSSVHHAVHGVAATSFQPFSSLFLTAKFCY
jgi:hypothetical protein